MAENYGDKCIWNEVNTLISYTPTQELLSAHNDNKLSLHSTHHT